MKSITLIGYMCAGKTTIGKQLSQRLDRTLYDLDWYIEERYHKRVPQIFADDGEAHFREIEQRMLHEVAEFEDIILSCGGGTPCFFDNMDYLNRVSHTVYLKASPEVLCRHIAQSRGERPLLKGKSPEELHDFVAAQLAEREPYYAQAQHIIDINVLDTFDKVSHIADAICQQLSI